MMVGLVMYFTLVGIVSGGYYCLMIDRRIQIILNMGWLPCWTVWIYGLFEQSKESYAEIIHVIILYYISIELKYDVRK